MSMISCNAIYYKFYNDNNAINYMFQLFYNAIFYSCGAVHMVSLAINPSARRFVKSLAEKPVSISHSPKNV